MKISEILSEYRVDNVNGLGAVPYNANVEYRGLRVSMRPSIFLSLAAHLSSPKSVDHISQHLKNGGALGAPYLIVDIPEQWTSGNFRDYAKVVGHEGRNRMLAVGKVEGDDPVEVHIFPKGELRARHLTDEIIKELEVAMINQDGKLVVGSRNLLFQPM